MGHKKADAETENSNEQQLGRFGFSSTPQIRALLSEAVQHPQASQELTALCQQHLDADAVPWKVVQRVCRELRQPASDQDSSSSSVVQQPAPVTCQGAKLVLPSPPARQRSKQLQEHLAKLQDKVDQQRYAEMVADVAQQEQKAAAAQDPFFPTTKLQMSFGLHVLATMGAFSVLGYYAGRLLLNSNTWAGVLGALGLAAGLLLETALLIIRTNMPVPLDQKYAHLLDKKWDTWQGKQGQQDAAGGSSSSRPAGAGKAQQRKRGGGSSRPEHAGHSKKE